MEDIDIDIDFKNITAEQLLSLLVEKGVDVTQLLNADTNQLITLLGSFLPISPALSTELGNLLGGFFENLLGTDNSVQRPNVALSPLSGSDHYGVFQLEKYMVVCSLDPNSRNCSNYASTLTSGGTMEQRLALHEQFKKWLKDPKSFQDPDILNFIKAVFKEIIIYKGSDHYDYSLYDFDIEEMAFNSDNQKLPTGSTPLKSDSFELLKTLPFILGGLFLFFIFKSKR